MAMLNCKRFDYLGATPSDHCGRWTVARQFHLGRAQLRNRPVPELPEALNAAVVPQRSKEVLSSHRSRDITKLRQSQFNKMSCELRRE
jgi:hypothetical protein